MTARTAPAGTSTRQCTAPECTTDRNTRKIRITGTKIEADLCITHFVLAAREMNLEIVEEKEETTMTAKPTTAEKVAAKLNDWNRQPAEDQDPANWFDIVEDADPINEIDDEFGAHTGDTAVFADGSSVEYTPGSFGGDWTANEAHECDDEFLAIDPSDPNPGSTVQFTREEYEAAGGDYAAMVEEFRTAGAWCCYLIDGVAVDGLI